MAARLARGGRVGGLRKGAMAPGSPWVLRGREASCTVRLAPRCWPLGATCLDLGTPDVRHETSPAGWAPDFPCGPSGWTRMSAAHRARPASTRPLTGPSLRPLFVDGAALREFTQSRVGLTQLCWRLRPPPRAAGPRAGRGSARCPWGSPGPLGMSEAGSHHVRWGHQAALGPIVLPPSFHHATPFHVPPLLRGPLGAWPKPTGLSPLGSPP